MMINKRPNIAGALTTLMLILNPKLGTCSWEDKEFYWHE